MKTLQSLLFDDDSFITALFEEDELGAVIRCHIHIESAIDLLIENRVNNYNYISKMHLDYSQKIHLAIAIGLPKEYAPALVSLGKIRNKFAHNLDTTISKSSMSDFYKAFPPTQKQIIQLAFKRSKIQLPLKGKSSISDLDPKEQFSIFSMALRTQILAAALDLPPLQDQQNK
jgi:hypothetical protein